jgi:hypothetical protein
MNIFKWPTLVSKRNLAPFVVLPHLPKRFNIFVLPVTT